MYKKHIIITLLFVILSGCSAASQQSQSYDDIKKSTLDALQTEEGKKVIRQLLEDPTMKDLLVLEHDDVNKAVQETLMSKKAEEYWKKQFEDPKFRETFAKSMKKEQQNLMKDLMKDDTFQKDLFLVIGFNVFLVLCQPPVNQIGCCCRPTHVAISVIIEGLVAVEPAGSFFPGQIFFLKQQRGIHRFISITEP